MKNIFESGKMFVGCNYWASHAGIFMWQDWRPEIVEDDFRRLAENRITTLRVFPLWSDFQPLRMHHAGSNSDFELRLREEPLPFTEAGQAGLDQEMLDHFEEFLKLAEKYGLRLIIGLVTGWMSGRMFAPEAFEDKNLLKDPMVVKWQIKYVRYMVKHFRGYQAIAAWDLGNECNCMSPLDNENETYVWASTIAMAIRSEDREHPILSGMHGLRAEGKWRMQDQADFLDVLTTHPYPIFVDYCATDPINRMKSALHAAAESQMYHDLSNLPCFIEEAGTLGPMVCSEEIAADYLQSSIFTAWAHNCYGFLWWCANEQSELSRTPYDWCAVERELGLFRIDRSKKPVLDFLREFSNFTDNLPFDSLPAQKIDAVCILTEGQDTWAAAYGAFILAKQAGLNIRFAIQSQKIPEAKAYLLPSLKENASVHRHVLIDLLERVKKGATLYISEDDALLSPFTGITGLTVQTRAAHPETREVCFDDRKMHIKTEVTLEMKADSAEVLACDDRNNPFFTKHHFGEGEIFYLNAPIEKLMSVQACITDGDYSEPYYLFYRTLGIRSDRNASVSDPFIGLTEHEVNESESILIVINYEPERKKAEIALKEGWKSESCDSMKSDCRLLEAGQKIVIDMPNNTGAVIRIKKI